ncbi:MAG: DNA topoisomerase (ATP-hydrolyzing) [Jaaginema sp. PMC 1079.18]|nr:DNA topoisomerase (ATP-hydrolyzing) [Jaaginema sp. PMC 1080.18]MEC4851391.1 DNA topoisomerase (ATP-hydrolyzing) [Jaaginema sp. PMC 1079.18]MEC4864483.1 DNA topoisomerase (ATP-hydrolyzing) [Jaaginema sp. PMC 1078.18]
MAKQLNLLKTGQVIPTALHSEMKRSYLEYAMSTIVGRALPDVRDGLKPVHRRILYAMHELGLTPDRPFRKCARVVGDVLGKYHPHGDQSVYDALVRMVQDFSSRYPLLDGHGNFGSVDNDPAAAMRYTETRLAPVAQQAMLSEIGEATVDFSSNFDNSQQEPVVLPAQLPLLLLNGCSGIAVGMATNVPPHNLGELVDGLIALIDRPSLTDEQLFQLIPGPDFPTGGEIIDTAGIEEAYRTGRGIIPMRGVARIEKVRLGKRRREKGIITITEFPFQVNKAGWIEKVAHLVNQSKLEGIADIRDESDRDGIRVVVETKRDANPQEVLRQLYKQTHLQSNFGAILLTLVDNKPCQLSLREILEQFLHFREETLTRQYNYELNQAQRRLQLVEGLLVALENLDTTIDILRHAPDGSTAKVSLQEQLNISEAQADSILAMPMRRLTGLERQKLESERQELRQRIEQLELLLGDRHELMKSLKKDLRALKRKFNDTRRTRIITLEPEPEVPQKASPAQKKAVKEAQKVADTLFKVPDDAVIEIKHNGTICWHSPPPENTTTRRVDETTVFLEPVKQRESLIVVTDSGKAYPLAIADIPSAGSQDTPIVNLLPASVQNKRESALFYFFPPKNLNETYLVLLTAQGRLKRLACTELADMTNRGAMLIKLKEDDTLRSLVFAEEGMNVAIATSGGRILRYALDDVQSPVMGRSAQGSQATRLRRTEVAVGCVTFKKDVDLIVATAQGYAKRLPTSVIRQANRGDIGTQALQFASKMDKLAQIIISPPESEQVDVVLSSDRLLHVPVKGIKLWGKDGTGDPLPNLKDGEEVVELIAV